MHTLQFPWTYTICMSKQIVCVSRYVVELCFHCLLHTNILGMMSECASVGLKNYLQYLFQKIARCDVAKFSLSLLHCLHLNVSQLALGKCLHLHVCRTLLCQALAVANGRKSSFNQWQATSYELSNTDNTGLLQGCLVWLGYELA